MGLEFCKIKKEKLFIPLLQNGLFDGSNLELLAPCFPPLPYLVSVHLPKSQWVEHVRFKDASMGQPSVLCFIIFRIQYYISTSCALVQIYNILCNCDLSWWISQMMIGSLSTSHFSQTASGILFIWFISPTN